MKSELLLTPECILQATMEAYREQQLLRALQVSRNRRAGQYRRINHKEMEL